MALVGLLDCHYELERRSWEWGWLEILLGREFNAALADRLMEAEIPVRWWSSDGARPKNTQESHEYKAECVLSHKPAPDLVIETHFNHTPPQWLGFLVEAWKDDPRSVAAAQKIQDRLILGLDAKVPLVRLPDQRYRTSGLFKLLEPRVPFVLLEAGSLDNIFLRAEYQNRDEDSRWWTVVHCVTEAIIEYVRTVDAVNEYVEDLKDETGRV